MTDLDVGLTETGPQPVRLALRAAASSDIGMVRAGNEDSGYAGRRLLVVCDGMGGHAAGEVASALAVSTLVPLDRPGAASGDPYRALVNGLRVADQAIGRRVGGNKALGGMGTTATVLLVSGPRAAVAQVGDSRAYRLRDGALKPLTHDQTYVQTLVDEGRITAEDARHHPQRSLLLQALDGTGGVDPEIHMVSLRAGDRLLLCSDGLTGCVPVHVVAEELGEGTPSEVAQRLVATARRAGAPDNVTVIIADVVLAADADPTPQVVGAAADASANPLTETGEVPAVGAPDWLLDGDEPADGDEPVDDVADDEPSDESKVARTPARARSAADPHVRDAATHDPFSPGELAHPSAPLALDVAGARMGAREPVAQGVLLSPGQRQGRSRWVRLLLSTLLALLLVGGTMTAVVVWAQQLWSVQVDNGEVVVVQGPGSVFQYLGLRKVTERTGVQVADLPPFDRSRVVEGIPAKSQADSDRIVGDLATSAAACKRAPAQCSGPLLGSSASQSP